MGQIVICSNFIAHSDRKWQFVRRGTFSFILTAVTLLIFWHVIPQSLKFNESSDYSTFYRPLAIRISEGNGITNYDDSPATRYPPGYPLILASVHVVIKHFSIPEDVALQVLTIVSLSLSAATIYAISAMTWNVKIGVLSSVLWALYPLNWWLSKQANSEIPFILIFYTGIFVFWSSYSRQRQQLWPYFITGAVLGLSMLIRPIALGATFVLVAFLFIRCEWLARRRKVMVAVCMLLGNLCAIAPWEAWIYHRTGKVILLSSAGPISAIDGLTFARHDQGQRFGADVVQLMRHIRIQTHSTESIYDVGKVVAISAVAHPLATTKLVCHKLLRSWFATESGRFDKLVLLIQIPFLYLFVLSSLTIGRGFGIRSDLVILLSMLTLYFWMMTVSVLSIVRYMVPIIGMWFTVVPGMLLVKEDTL